MNAYIGRACGTCTFCCKVMEIEELSKPVGDWCPHCRPGKGCGVYASRPKPCVDFVCQWLADPTLPDALRPDRVRVMLGGDKWGHRYIARCDPANAMAWRNEPIYSVLKNTAKTSWHSAEMVLVLAYKRTWLITPAADYDLGVVDPRSPIAVEKNPDGTARYQILPPPEEGDVFKPATR